MNDTKPIDNPTLNKIELIKNYQKKDITLNDVVNRIYGIDNPPPSRKLQIFKMIVLILLGPLISSSQRDK